MNNKPFLGYHPKTGLRPGALVHAKPELPYTVNGVKGKGSRSREIRILCPFCNTGTWVNDWSFQRQGKKCNCGAHFRQDGIAIAIT